MTLSNWSRIGAATLVGGMVVLGAATPALAAPGDADATAFDLALDATVLGVPLLDVDTTLASVTAPPDADSGLIDLTAVLSGIGLGVTDGTVSSTATSGPAGSVGDSTVEDLAVSLLGLPISAGVVTGTATCPTGGTPTAEATVVGLNVLGVPVDAELGADLTVPVVLPLVPGATGATLRAVVTPSAETTTATTADATALMIALSLDVTVVVPLATVDVGTITLGDASCTAPAAVAPTATTLAPTSGPVAGGTTVTVDGSGFLPGLTSVLIGGTTVPAADVTVVSPTRLTFPAPAHPAGTVDVTAITVGGTTTPALAYAYLAVPGATSLAPTAGPPAGGTTVTVTGSGFVAGATTVTTGGTTVPATVTGPTTLTYVAPAHAAGPVDVTVTTAGGTSTPVLGYAYLPAPTLSALTPASGPDQGGDTVTVTGTGFVAGATSVTIDGTVVPATVTSPTTLTFPTPAHAAGLVAVTATTPSGVSGPLGFTYLGAPVPGVPTATALTPATGPAAGGTAVTVQGTGFVPGATVTVDGVPATAVTVVGPTQLTFVTPAGTVGLADVVVTTPAGSAPPLGFTYVAAPAPVATSLTPAAGPSAGGTTVTVSGSGFVPGLTTVTIGGVTVPATGVTVTSPATLSFRTPAHAAGTVELTVTVPAGTSTPLGFTYQVVAPTATGPTPGSGPTTGGTTLTIDGTGFTPGTTVTIDGVRVPVTVVSPTRITVVTPAHAAGSVTVVIGTGGGSVSLTFRYVAGAALASTGVDTAVPLAGGALALLAGTGLLVGARRRRSAA